MAYIKYHSMNEVCEFQLPEDKEVLFGRSQMADFELQDAAVSRKHFTLKMGNNNFIITDLGSHNGTRVNNTVLHDEQHILKNGDEIQLTNYSFHFVTTNVSEQISTNAAILAAQDSADTADFDDSTVAFKRPLSDTAMAKAFHNLTAIGSDEEQWTNSLRDYALDIINDAEEFKCSYKQMTEICDSFPNTGEVVAAKLMAKGVIKEIGKEFIETGETYPSGKPRKAEVIIWKLL